MLSLIQKLEESLISIRFPRELLNKDGQKDNLENVSLLAKFSIFRSKVSAFEALEYSTSSLFQFFYFCNALSPTL